MWLPDISGTLKTYLTICQALEDSVQNGSLRPGDRLPTHRQLAEALGVSLGTVTRGYAVARSRGLIEGVTGRGTFVAQPGNTVGADPVAEETALDASWPLYAFDPDLSTALRDIAADRSCRHLLRYQPNAGMHSHRLAGANWIARLGLHANEEDVSVCAGTQHALTVLLTALAEPGETILTDSLTYPGLKSIARLLRLNVVGVQNDRNGLVPDAFDTACRLRNARVLYCIPTFHNPTATTLAEERRRDIASIAERNGVHIIEDAVHQALAPDAPAPMAVHAPEHTFFVASLSKVLAGGLRVAYVVSPPGWQERVSRGIWATNWMAAPLCAEVARRWIEDGTAVATAAAKRTEAGERVVLALDKLGRFGLVTGRYSYHAWLPLPSKWESNAFANEARRLGTPVTGADAFAVGPESAPSAVRLSLSAPHTRDGLERALTTIALMLEGEPSALGPVV